MRSQRRLVLGLWVGLAAAALASPSLSRADLLVGSTGTNSVLAYDETTGAPKGVAVDPDLTGLVAPNGIAFGRDGNVYVASFDVDAGLNDILVVDQAGNAVNQVGLTGIGSFPYGVAFGPDGLLYVAGFTSRNVLKIDAITGDVTEFVPAGSGGLRFPLALTFGPDGNLYVASPVTGTVLRYNGVTGALMGTFVAAGSGGLAAPLGVTFGVDGHLYVADGSGDTVLRYDGATGAFKDVFVSKGRGGLSTPFGLAFGPDGSLYVVSADTNSVLRYNGTTGAFVDVFVTAGSGGLSSPQFLAFSPKQRFLCYSTRASRGTPRFLAITDVDLNDEFSSLMGRITGVADLCTPATVKSSPPLDPVTHLVGYRYLNVPEPGNPDSIPSPHKGLAVTNEFGTVTLDTLRPEQMLVTSTKGFDPLNPPDPPDPSTNFVNNYACYTVRTSTGAPRFASILGVPVVDQFKQPKTVDLRRLTHLCTPMTSGFLFADVHDPGAHLLCYQATPSARQPRHAAIRNIQVNNDLGPLALDTVIEDELCIQSSVVIPSP